MAFWGTPWRRARGLVSRRPSGRERKRLSVTSRRRLPLERLEDRALLTITTSFVDGHLSVSSDWSDALVLTVDQGDVKINGADPSIGPIAASEVTGLTVRGGLLSPVVDASGTSDQLAVDGVSITIPRVSQVIADFRANTSLGPQLEAALASGALTQERLDQIAAGQVTAESLQELASAGISQEWIDKGLEALDFFHAQHAGGPSSGQSLMSASVPNNNQYVYGTSGPDELTGGDNDQVFYGGQGNDSIDGGEGNDVIYGGKGDDYLDGGEGKSAFFSGHDDDTLIGGDGNDTWADGGEGHDTFDQGGSNGMDFGVPPVIAISDTTVVENAGYATFGVTLNNPFSEDVSIPWNAANGTATSPDDFTSSSSTLTILAGQTSGTISMPIVNDIADETNETFSVQLGTPSNATIGDPIGVATIIDNDTPTANMPTVSISLAGADGIVYEGEGAPFTITLSHAINKTVRVHYATTTSGTAIDGTHYKSVSRDLYFAPNQTSQQIGVELIDDLMYEGGTNAPYFFVVLSSPLNATIGTASGYAIIYDDDDPPTLSINDVTVTEGDPGGPAVNATFTLSLTNPINVPIAVALSIGPATALYSSDYSGSTTINVTIPAGQTFAQFSVPITADLTPEPTEFFYATITSAGVYTTDYQGTCQIVDNDRTVTVDIDTDSNNDGPITGDDEGVELNPLSRYIAVNDDDDNGNHIRDNGNEAGAVNNENDLALVELSANPMNYTPEQLANSHLRLEITSGFANIRIWRNDNRTGAVAATTEWAYSQMDQWREVFIEGMFSGSATIDLVFYDHQGSERARDSIRVTVIQIDVDLDSDNNNQLNAPDRSTEEDDLEDNAQQVGKVILADRLDANGDGVPDYADGIDRYDNFAVNQVGRFVPVVFTISDDIPLNVAQVTLSYSAANPGLVTRTPEQGTALKTYEAGSTEAIRLWTKDGADARRSASVLANQPGDYLAPGVYRADQIFRNGQRTAIFYVEGINETAQAAARIRLQLDPAGNGRYIAGDAARATVLWVQVVYTDVTGIRGIGNTPANQVPRIDRTIEPDGIAADWMTGVDDGAILLMRLVGSPLLATMVNSGAIQVAFGMAGADVNGPTFSALPGGLVRREGEYRTLTDTTFVPNANDALHNLSIETVGETFNPTSRVVVAARFYKSPIDFDVDDMFNNAKERKLNLAVRFSGQTQMSGSKPNAVFITRPPLVLVHGINSDPDTWDEDGKADSFLKQFDTGPESYGFQADFFRVNHQGLDPVPGFEDQNGNGILEDIDPEDPGNPISDWTLGFGDIAHMYLNVQNMVRAATNAFRNGRQEKRDTLGRIIDVGPTFDAIGREYDPNGLNVPGKLIAVQKVDIVAHSYGGLLSRWYIEQSPDYENRHDVRKLVTLGTPHLGSPLANMIDEILKGGLIADARGGAPSFELRYLAAALDEPAYRNDDGQNLGAILDWVHSHLDEGRLPNALDLERTRPRHALEILAVNSPRLQQLNAHPFRDDVAYAAVVGTQTSSLGLDFYSALEPHQPPGQPSDLGYFSSYFPWLKGFDAGENDTDGVVPAWSAALGVSSYNRYVETTHGGLVYDDEVNFTVRSWLRGSMPLGDDQRAAWEAQPPVSVRNAYDGGHIDPTTNYSVGAGLNRNAIIKVEINPADTTSPYYGTKMFVPTGQGFFEAATIALGSDPDDPILVRRPGILHPVLTGMIRRADRDAADFQIVATDQSDSTVLDNIVVGGSEVLPEADLNIPEWAAAGAVATDWMPFRVDLGRIGRTSSQVVTGPDGATASMYNVRYRLNVLNGGGLIPDYSPATKVTVLPFVLPAPQPVAAGSLIMRARGATEARDATLPSQNVDVWLYDYDGFFGVGDDPLGNAYFALTHPAGTWDGVLLPYQQNIGLFLDGQGKVAGTYGGSGENPAQVYQYLVRPWTTPNQSSATITVP